MPRSFINNGHAQDAQSLRTAAGQTRDTSTGRGWLWDKPRKVTLHATPRYPVPQCPGRKLRTPWARKLGWSTCQRQVGLDRRGGWTATGWDLISFCLSFSLFFFFQWGWRTSDHLLYVEFPTFSLSFSNCSPEERQVILEVIHLHQAANDLASKIKSFCQAEDNCDNF